MQMLIATLIYLWGVAVFPVLKANILWIRSNSFRVKIGR